MLITTPWGQISVDISFWWFAAAVLLIAVVKKDWD